MSIANGTSSHTADQAHLAVKCLCKIFCRLIRNTALFLVVPLAGWINSA